MQRRGKKVEIEAINSLGHKSDDPLCFLSAYYVAPLPNSSPLLYPATPFSFSTQVPPWVGLCPRTQVHDKLRRQSWISARR